MNQKPFRTLFLWCVWAATAIIAYATLYRGTDVWDFVQQDPSKITWLILGLFTLGVIGSFILSLVLTFESLTAYRIDDQASGHGLQGVRGHKRKRAVTRFFEALKSTMEANGQPDVEALLTTELAVYQRVSRTIEVIGNLLITLGLIGTVMGLTLTLTGLTSSLDALGHDQEMLLSGLRKAMAGMGTAFYTTLLGAVLGGVLLRVFAQITEHGVEGLYDKVMRICLVYCSADLRATPERDIRFLNTEIEALGAHVKYLQSVFDDSRTAMTDFRTELAELRRNSEGENEALINNIKMHKHYSEMLREEAKLMKEINKPWWVRLREALGMSKP